AGVRIVGGGKCRTAYCQHQPRQPQTCATHVSTPASSQFPSVAKFNAQRGCQKAWRDPAVTIVSVTAQPLHAELAMRISPDLRNPQARASREPGKPFQRVFATVFDQHRLVFGEVKGSAVDVRILFASADDVGLDPFRQRMPSGTVPKSAQVEI